MVRHHDQCEREEDGVVHVDIILPVLKEKFQIQRDKEFTTVAFFLGVFKTRFEICKDEDGGLKFFRAIQGHSGGFFVSTKTDEFRDDSLHMERIHLSRGLSTRPILYCSSWIGRRRKGAKKKDGKQFSSLLMILSTAMPTKQNYLQISTK